MRKLAWIVVLVLAAALVAAEIATPPFVEARIEEQVRTRTRELADVEADVDSFPLLTRTLVTGRVSRLSVDLREVLHQELRITSVRLLLHGLELDRGALLQGEARVRDIERGEVTLELSGDALTAALGVPIEVRRGAAVVQRAGEALGVDLAVEGGALLLRGPAGLSLRAPLPGDLMPCAPAVEVLADRILLTCSFEGVPPLLQDG